MKSCQDYLSELRQKVHCAEDQLRSEKKNLYKTSELFTEEKDKWAAEIKEDELKIRKNDIQIREKEAELDQLKTSYEEILKKCLKLEGENEKLKRDLQKAKTEKESKLNMYLLEQGNLENELSKVQDQQRDIKVSNKWAKIFQEKELRTHEADLEGRLRDEIKQMSDDFVKKIETFDENLKEIDSASLGPKKQRLAALREALEQINNECKDLEEKNKALEKQIRLLDEK